MNAEELQDEKKRLIESIGVYFEHEKQMAPLAARILATIIIHGNKGTTFEQLVTDLQASKSTVFTHLTTLTSQKQIGYFTKCGDRKRYYAMIPGYITRKINSLISQWDKEVILQKQLLNYKKAHNRLHSDNPLATSFHEDTLDFLTGAISYFEKLESDFQKKEKNYNSDLL